MVCFARLRCNPNPLLVNDGILEFISPKFYIHLCFNVAKKKEVKHYEAR